MCYNCEGEIDLDVIVCPFCAADLREEKPEQQMPHYNPSATLKNLNTQQSLYPAQGAPKVEQEEAPEEAPQAVVVERDESKNIFIPIALLTLGSQLFLFGFLMLFFSNEGVMTLKWDARFWYTYALAAVPLLAFGYKFLNRL